MQVQLIPRVLVSALSCLLFLVPLTSAKTYYVNPGQSIQAAIDGASPGDRIQVAAGTYTEQLLITKNGIDLRGSAVTLLAPASYRQNRCNDYFGSLENSLLCIAGPTYETSVSGVSVTGFTFSGIRRPIVVLGANDISITKNRFLNTQSAAIDFERVSDSKIQSNEIDGGNVFSEAGIYFYGGQNIKAAQNTIQRSYSGIVGYSPFSNIENNDIKLACLSVVVLGYGITVSHNQISSVSPICSSVPDRLLYNTGVYIGGPYTSEWTIDHNDIQGQQDSGRGAAIRIEPEQATAKGVITTNTLRSNDANIVESSNSGAGVTATKNTCTNPATNCNF